MSTLIDYWLKHKQKTSIKINLKKRKQDKFWSLRPILRKPEDEKKREEDIAGQIFLHQTTKVFQQNYKFKVQKSYHNLSHKGINKENSYYSKKSKEKIYKGNKIGLTHTLTLLTKLAYLSFYIHN